MNGFYASLAEMGARIEARAGRHIFNPQIGFPKQTAGAVGFPISRVIAKESSAGHAGDTKPGACPMIC